MSVYIYNSLRNISQVIIVQFYNFTDSNCVFVPTVFPATLAKLELISDGVRQKSKHWSNLSVKMTTAM